VLVLVLVLVLELAVAVAVVPMLSFPPFSLRLQAIGHINAQVCLDLYSPFIFRLQASGHRDAQVCLDPVPGHFRRHLVLLPMAPDLCVPLPHLRHAGSV